MTLDRQQWDRTYAAGRSARQAGRGIDTCPRYGITPDARLLVERWKEGWDDEDQARAKAGGPRLGTTVAPLRAEARKSTRSQA